MRISSRSVGWSRDVVANRKHARMLFHVSVSGVSLKAFDSSARRHSQRASGVLVESILTSPPTRFDTPRLIRDASTADGGLWMPFAARDVEAGPTLVRSNRLPATRVKRP